MIHRMREKGYTLLELLLATSIIAFTIGGIISFGAASNNNADVKISTEEIMGLYTGVAATYKHQGGDYTGVTPAIMAGSLHTPSGLRNGATLVNIFGSNVGVSGGADFFIISYAVPDAAMCVDISLNIINRTDRIRTTGGIITSRATADIACTASLTLLVEGP